MSENRAFISPEMVSSKVTFERDNFDWQYNGEKRGDMPAKQAEGVAYAWNIMQEHKMALLADEVGMGKTIQALSICSFAWLRNSDARVLVFAPRESVANNWLNEFSVFVDSHYKHGDDIVKTAIGNEPVYRPMLCKNLYELSDLLKKRSSRLYIAKTTSFSYLDSDNSTKGMSKAEKARKAAGKLKDSIVETLGKRPIDLLIIDEVQYYRCVNGNSQRVQAARAFFEELAQNVLLMTATPNHADLEDIPNICTYFDYLYTEEEKLSYKQPREILENIAIRRYRVLSNKVKYQYRREIAPMSSFAEDPRSEMFFACYQKQLVGMELEQQKKRKKDLSSGRLMYGYLEGFEFIPSENQADDIFQNEDDQSCSDDTRKPDDFREADDSLILQDLALNFRQSCGMEPSHPKYNKMVDILSPDSRTYWQNGKEKDLVFIRRISSGNEITRRVIDRYDDVLAEMILKGLGGSEYSPEEIMSRDHFCSIFSVKDEGTEVISQDELENEDLAIHEKMPSSKILDLFKTKPNDGNRNTDASLFRLRFSRTRSLFTTFFQAGLFDTQTIVGQLTITHQVRTKDKGPVVIEHFASAGVSYWFSRDEKKVREEIVALKYAPRDSSIERTETHSVDTLWTLFFSHIMNSDDHEKDALIKAWQELEKDGYMLEAFLSWVKKGLLFGSAALIELYTCYLSTVREETAVEEGWALYGSFADRVKEYLPGSNLLKTMKEALLHFSLFISKIDHKTNRIRLVQDNWNLFNNAQPAYPYTGGSKNESVLKGFNSPFFPNVLVATSVLQEGVNLQYFCKNVHHYGLAWTPGDNEQRAGRIDRMMGYLERELKRDSNACLNIYYPYLKSTLDENQLGSFLLSKVRNESALDNCENVCANKSIDIEDVHLEDYLSTPKDKSGYDEPYYRHERYSKISTLQLPSRLDRSDELIQHINELCSEVTLFSEKEISYFPSYFPKKFKDRIAYITTSENDQSNRDFSVRLRFESTFSALVDTTVYILTIESSQFSINRQQATEECHFTLENNYHSFFKMFPMIQLVSDYEGKSESLQAQVRVEIPLFTDSERKSYLESNEIDFAIRELLNAYYSMQHINTGNKLSDYVPRYELKWITKMASFKIKEDSKWVQDIETGHAIIKKNINRNMQSLLETLNSNNSYPFISFAPKNDTSSHIMRIAYPTVSFQASEQELLEMWYDHVYSVENIRQERDWGNTHDYDEYDVFCSFRYCVRDYPDGVNKAHFYRDVLGYFGAGIYSEKKARTLDSFLNTAARRKIIYYGKDTIYPGFRHIDDYEDRYIFNVTKKFIKKNPRSKRDITRLVKEYFGFAMITSAIEKKVGRSFNQMSRGHEVTQRGDEVWLV